MPDGNEIYKFLKENGLTQKDEATFTSEYSDPKKAAELHKFFVDNQLTTKDSAAFYDTYFNPQKKKGSAASTVGKQDGSRPKSAFELTNLEFGQPSVSKRPTTTRYPIEFPSAPQQPKPKIQTQSVANWGQQRRMEAEGNLFNIGVQPQGNFADIKVAEDAVKQAATLSTQALDEEMRTMLRGGGIVAESTRPISTPILPKGLAPQTTQTQKAKEAVDNLQNVVKQKRRDIGVLHGAAVAKQNPNLTPFEIGEQALKVTDPDLYKAYERAGKADRMVQRQIEELGIEAAAAAGGDDVRMGTLAQSIETLDDRYPEIRENIVRHKLAAKAYEQAGALQKFTGGIWTVEKMDELAKTLSPQDKAIYDQYIRPEEEKLGMWSTNMPNWGLAKFGEGFGQIVEGTALGSANIVGLRTDRDVEAARLEQMGSTRYASVGDSEFIRQRKKELQKKGDKTAAELQELEELKATENAMGAAGKFLEGTASTTGQVAAFALMARGVGNALATPFARAGLISGRAAAGTGIDAIASTAVDFGIKKGVFDTIGMIASEYLASDEGARQQALAIFPDDADKDKRTAFAETMRWSNAVSGMIFRDTKVLDAFNDAFGKNVSKIVKNMNLQNIGSQEFKQSIKEAAKEAMKFAGKAGANINQEAMEESAVVLSDLVAQAILAPEKLNAADKIEEMWNTYAAMAVDGTFVGAIGGLADYKQGKVYMPFVSNLGRAGFEDYTTQISTEIDKQEASGELTAEQAQEKRNILNAFQKQNEIVDKTPALAAMKGRQRQKYVSMAVAEQLKRREAAEVAAIDPVAAQVINNEIQEMQNARQGIVSGENFVMEDGGVLPVKEAEKVIEQQEQVKKARRLSKLKSDETEEGRRTTKLEPINAPLEAVAPKQIAAASKEDTKETATAPAPAVEVSTEVAEEATKVQKEIDRLNKLREEELLQDAKFMKGAEKSQIENSKRIINKKYDQEIEKVKKGFVPKVLSSDEKQVYKNIHTTEIKGDKYEFAQVNDGGSNNVFVVEKDGVEIGKATLNKDGYFDNIRIDEKYRRKGLATKMYDYVESVTGIDLQPSPIKQSPEAKKLWEKKTLKESVSKNVKGGIFAKALGGAMTKLVLDLTQNRQKLLELEDKFFAEKGITKDEYFNLDAKEQDKIKAEANEWLKSQSTASAPKAEVSKQVQPESKAAAAPESADVESTAKKILGETAVNKLKKQGYKIVKGKFDRDAYADFFGVGEGVQADEFEKSGLTIIKPFEKIKVFRGVGKNVEKGDNNAIQWVAEDERIAKNYSSENQIQQLEVNKPQKAFENPENDVYVTNKDVANRLRKIRDKLFRDKKIDKKQAEIATSFIDEFEQVSGNEPELYSTKTNKKESADLYAKSLISLGYDGIVQKESFDSKSPFKQTTTENSSNTYGIFNPKLVKAVEQLLGKPKEAAQTAAIKPEIVTEKEVAETAKKTGITPKNLRDLYNINRKLFGLDRIKSLAAAIAMDRMVGAMAKRAGITKEQMYGRLKFEKDTEANVLKSDNALFQGVVDGKPVTLRNMDVDVVNGFYSPIEKNLKEYGKDKIKAKDWLNVVGKGDEAVFTGVRAFLEGKDPNAMVSKQEILDYMKDNRISVVEVVKGSYKEGFLNDQWTPGAEENKGTGRIWKNNGWKVVENSKSDYSIFYPDGTQFEGSWSTKEGAFDRVRMEAPSGTTKFSQYQLEGEKENYKEVLVTLPEKPYFKNDVSYIKVNGEWYGAASAKEKLGISDIRNLSTGDKVNGYFIDGTKQINRETNDNFKSTHFDEPNILVHLRMNTRTDSDGKKVLFLEEVQSDFNASYRKSQDMMLDYVNKNENEVIELYKKSGKLVVEC